MHFLRHQLPALIAAMISLTSAHVVMESPVPYGADHIDTNPLLADGSDFPCKQRDNVYKLIKQNIMPIGQNQTLSFKGQATHGGGTCQISLSTDKQPTKQSVWKVIHTIEGGCPSSNPGNVGTNPFGYGADKFQFAIPPQIPTGDYTLAWTWFNKIGNREMYMNCAPITVTAGAAASQRRNKRRVHRHGAAIIDRRQSSIQERTTAISSLPNMFVANIGNGCSTAESGTTLAIPQQNMGNNVQHLGSDTPVPPVGSCGGKQAVAAAPPPSQPQSSAPAPSPAPTTIAPEPPKAPSPAPAPPSPSPPPPPSSPPAQPQAPSAPPAGSPAPPPPVPAGLQSGPCTTPGKSVCSPDGMGFGTCDEFHRVIFAPAPVGTRCDPSLGVLVQAQVKVEGRMFKA
ncbi:MAG: hypothetical protein Q9219_005543 [cf. Caloplaca sp. 3 TL-2023]